MSNEFTEPSCSSKNTIKPCLEYEQNTLELNITNDKEELQRLETAFPQKITDEKENIEIPVEDERIAKIDFHCSSCDMHEMVHYFGLQPPFVFGIKFREATYILRDPFQAPPSRWKPKAEYFVALGAHCQKCDSVVCKDNACSFFYIHSYCLTCARDVALSWPLDIQQKLNKQLSVT